MHGQLAGNSHDGKLHHLEALRGIAAIIVVLSHLVLGFLLPAAEPSVEATPLNVLVNGSGAVSVFFVLSGLVLPLGFLRDRDMRGWVASVVKRFPRLYLPAAISMLAGWAALTWLPHFFVDAGTIRR